MYSVIKPLPCTATDPRRADEVDHTDFLGVILKNDVYILAFDPTTDMYYWFSAQSVEAATVPEDSFRTIKEAIQWIWDTHKNTVQIAGTSNGKEFYQ